MDTIYIIGFLVCLLILYTYGFVKGELFEKDSSDTEFWLIPILPGLIWFIILPAILVGGIGYLLSKLINKIKNKK